MWHVSEDSQCFVIHHMGTRILSPSFQPTLNIVQVAFHPLILYGVWITFTSTRSKIKSSNISPCFNAWTLTLNEWTNSNFHVHRLLQSFLSLQLKLPPYSNNDLVETVHWITGPKIAATAVAFQFCYLDPAHLLGKDGFAYILVSATALRLNLGNLYLELRWRMNFSFTRW